MAGHSKWANIKHRKAAQDAKRGKIFTKLIRELTVAAKMGGGEPNDNPRLRAAIDKALGQNMTRDTIDRAVKRGAGGDDDGNMDEITYEGYGKGGVAVLVETMTDNVNRTVAEVRHAFSKFAGNLGTSGSVAFLFTKRGEIFFESGVDEEKLMEVALEAGAEDVEEVGDDGFVVTTTPDKSFGEVVDALREAGLEFAEAEVTMHPSTEAEMDADTAETVQKMIDMLEDLDDVQNVYTNASWPAPEDESE
ncbi:YebC/PmpR family DNA-binding transcriptional regulator [Alcanivorax sp.]|jgi:YebC/PmpR family DNA-binding regulatory protein|uniref:YebC/PmpR family DNA-binding transcriptional regulator n=1 Tax=Alcanivorax sp. TaxID=1872427 RepID=UPI0025C1C16D|nr:YebC/PmpR family DNA-binding transcriptional regulator [Alcanivorax sp.]